MDLDINYCGSCRGLTASTLSLHEHPDCLVRIESFQCNHCHTTKMIQRLHGKLNMQDGLPSDNYEVGRLGWLSEVSRIEQGAA